MAPHSAWKYAFHQVHPPVWVSMEIPKNKFLMSLKKSVVNILIYFDKL